MWKYCPKVLFMGKTNVELACALAVLSFNGGAVSLINLLKKLKIEPSVHCQAYLKKKDKLRIQKSTIESSEKGKQARRVARRRRKGFEDKKRDAEGVMYAAGAFDTDTPGPSKHKKVTT